MTATLSSVASVLGSQLAHYGDRRILRDDEGGDPALRLQEAAQHLVMLCIALDQANEAARRYQCSAGHIAVEIEPLSWA
jgi:hypothetical protein